MIRSSIISSRRIMSSNKFVTRAYAASTTSSSNIIKSLPNISTQSSLVGSTTQTILSRSSPLALNRQTTLARPTPLVFNRQFSSEDDASTHLGSVLTREINEEEEASSGGIPPELSELQSTISSKWTILEGITGIGGTGETGSGATVRLFRKESGSKGAKIGVVFHCQDTEDDVNFDENDMFERDESTEDDEEEPAQAVRFGVVVSKGGKTVVLQCRSGYEVSVESVMVRDGDTESVLSELAGGEGLHAALYQGPEFTELAEDLQESFQTYVIEECGIDEDVTAFISMYSDYREQEEYVSWMKTAVDILD